MPSEQYSVSFLSNLMALNKVIFMTININKHFYNYVHNVVCMYDMCTYVCMYVRTMYVCMYVYICTYVRVHYVYT